jgi:hypothetical protein
MGVHIAYIEPNIGHGRVLPIQNASEKDRCKGIKGDCLPTQFHRPHRSSLLLCNYLLYSKQHYPHCPYYFTMRANKAILMVLLVVTTLAIQAAALPGGSRRVSAPGAGTVQHETNQFAIRNGGNGDWPINAENHHIHEEIFDPSDRYNQTARLTSFWAKDSNGVWQLYGTHRP